MKFITQNKVREALHFTKEQDNCWLLKLLQHNCFHFKLKNGLSATMYSLENKQVVHVKKRVEEYLLDTQRHYVVAINIDSAVVYFVTYLFCQDLLKLHIQQISDLNFKDFQFVLLENGVFRRKSEEATKIFAAIEQKISPHLLPLLNDFNVNLQSKP
jgi:hypothetical protein